MFDVTRNLIYTINYYLIISYYLVAKVTVIPRFVGIPGRLFSEWRVENRLALVSPRSDPVRGVRPGPVAAPPGTR